MLTVKLVLSLHCVCKGIMCSTSQWANNYTSSSPKADIDRRVLITCALVVVAIDDAAGGSN